MVGAMDTEALARYLEKQREIRLLSEEVESLKTSEAIRQALRIKHELEAMMADYDLTPEQVMEVLVVFFGVNKPMKLTGEPKPADVPKADVGESAGAVQETVKPQAAPAQVESGNVEPDTSEERVSQSRPPVSPRAETMVSLSPGRTALSGDGNPARKVTIRRKRSIPAEGEGQSAFGGYADVDQSSSAGAEAPVGDLLGEAAPSESAKSKPGRPKGSTTKKKTAEAAETRGGKGRRRKLRVYTNPYTGQVVKTRGANHRTLNEWRIQYGRDEVDQWWVEP